MNYERSYRSASEATMSIPASIIVVRTVEEYCVDFVPEQMNKGEQGSPMQGSVSLLLLDNWRAIQALMLI